MNTAVSLNRICNPINFALGFIIQQTIDFFVKNIFTDQPSPVKSRTGNFCILSGLDRIVRYNISYSNLFNFSASLCRLTAEFVLQAIAAECCIQPRLAVLILQEASPELDHLKAFSQITPATPRTRRVEIIKSKIAFRAHWPVT